MTVVIGEGRTRVDAEAKVRGIATYAAEHRIDGLAHALIVASPIARGRIEQIDIAAAQRVPGVIAVLTHESAPHLNGEITGRPGLDKKLLLLNSAEIVHDRQPVAVIVAETLAAAHEAAAAIDVRYTIESPLATIDDPRATESLPAQTAHGESPENVRGDAAAARDAADVIFSATYTTPVENHNPIEPHATIARWDDGTLTIYDATQGVFETRRKLAGVFGIPAEQVHVISPYVGGGFGNKGSVWEHQALAALAARETGRPVKLVLPRDQMFSNTGHRPYTTQTITFGARADGTLTSLEHDIIGDTSMYDVFIESSGEYTAMAYAVPNAIVRHRYARINVGTPTFMRAPGEATGSYVIESALDELAVTLDLDPIELRLRNYAETDPDKDKPFSTKYLRECYARGAERFGWERRDPRPRSMRDGRLFIGLGMAGGSYPSQIFNASASVTMNAAGDVIVRSGTQEIGQGSYTAIAQIAADELGIDPSRVRMELGDTAFPRAMNSGGSTTIASVGSAVALACRDLRRQLAARTGAPAGDLTAHADFEEPDKRKGYSCNSFAAQFAEVAVDPDFGTVRVRRMYGVFDVGRVINARLARSQFIGAMTMGIGMALLEQTFLDPRTARVMNANLADYKLPVNTDVGEIEAEALGYPDEIANEIGTKPIGEIGICGAAAAIANAVYHATGKRVRDLPITPAKLR
jgi:xanthine dehydrogenase YagR molybdenum-binding subunit